MSNTYVRRRPVLLSIITILMIIAGTLAIISGIAVIALRNNENFVPRRQRELRHDHVDRYRGDHQRSDLDLPRRGAAQWQPNRQSARPDLRGAPYHRCDLRHRAPRPRHVPHHLDRLDLDRRPDHLLPVRHERRAGVLRRVTRSLGLGSQASCSPHLPSSPPPLRSGVSPTLPSRGPPSQAVRRPQTETSGGVAMSIEPDAAAAR